MITISLVVPCYNEQEALPRFYEEVCKVSSSMNEIFEFVFVDDGSRDKTLEIIKELSLNDSRVHFVSFSRNFGKEAALYAGMEHASGDFVATMDADLQDPPSLLPSMLKAVTEEGYDCAGTRRVSRKGEPAIRSLFARMFYKIMKKLSDINIVDGARDYWLMSRAYVDALLSLKERNRFSKGLFPWVGFRTKWFEYENIERIAGETKWSFWKLFLYSLDGIMAFSTKPLAIASFLGFAMSFIAASAIVVVIIRKIVFGDPVAGWASLVCIMLFCSGAQLISIGILGEYLAKTYIEVKARPSYIVREER